MIHNKCTFLRINLNVVRKTNPSSALFIPHIRSVWIIFSFAMSVMKNVMAESSARNCTLLISDHFPATAVSTRMFARIDTLAYLALLQNTWRRALTKEYH